MAQRRMFSNKVIDTDIFLDLPLSTQVLYFHLSMRADDDGFIAAPKRIMRLIGCTNDEIKLLIVQGFLIPFENGVCVIKHWRIHNYIRNDRYTETIYKREKSMLISENGVYKLDEKNKVVDEMSYQMDTQVRLGKDRLELGKGSNKAISSKEIEKIIETWNNLKLSKIIKIKNDRLKSLNARVKEYNIKEVIKAIESIENSSFLKGDNDRKWVVTFDWVVKPNNFIKLLEGNYLDRKEDKNENSYDFIGNEDSENVTKWEEEIDI